jgi:3-oxoacyl-[acyl-carrier-protein] synthase II
VHILARRRVVITGLGVVSPVGNSVEEAWQNIIAGRSGIAPITRFDTSSFPVQFAGEVRNFDITQYISAKDARRMDTFIHYGLAAAFRRYAMPGWTRKVWLISSASVSPSVPASAVCR